MLSLKVLEFGFQNTATTLMIIIIITVIMVAVLVVVHCLSGMGRGLVGVITRPASGVVDFASSSFEGIRR